MFDVLRSRTTVSGRLQVLSALRVGAAKSTALGDTDLPVIRDVLGRPFIPGSSIKGVVRSYIESIVRAFEPAFGDGRGACLPTSREKQDWCVPDPDALREENQTDQEYTDKLLAKHCRVCQAFGSPWIASKVKFADACVVDDTWFDKYLIRDGVAIDRDTGTAADARKFDFEVVPGGTEFELRVVADNATEEELGLLHLGLSALGRQEIGLGGMTSRGPGQVALNDLAWRRVTYGPANIEALLGTAQGDDVSPHLTQWARRCLESLTGGPTPCTASS